MTYIPAEFDALVATTIRTLLDLEARKASGAWFAPNGDDYAYGIQSLMDSLIATQGDFWNQPIDDPFIDRGSFAGTLVGDFDVLYIPLTIGVPYQLVIATLSDTQDNPRNPADFIPVYTVSDETYATVSPSGVITPLVACVVNDSISVSASFNGRGNVYAILQIT